MPTARIVIETVPEWDDAGIRAVLEDLAHSRLAPDDEAVIYRGRNLLWRMVVAGESVAVKRFRTRGWWGKLSYRLRPGKARRSFRYAGELIRRGVTTPAPRALIEVWRGGWLDESYYLCADLGPVPQIRRALLDADFPDRCGHCLRLGAQLATMHAAGVWHRDMTAGNVLVVPAGPTNVSTQRQAACSPASLARDRHGPDEQSTLPADAPADLASDPIDTAMKTATQWAYHLVDLNRLRFGPVQPARGVANLATLEARDDLRDALLRGYCHARGLDLAWARHRYERAYRGHRWRWAIKKGTRRWRRWLFQARDSGGR